MNDKMSAHFESGGHGPLFKVPFLTASTLLLLNKGPLLFSLMVCLHSTLLFLINLSKKSNLWCFLHLQPATWHRVIKDISGLELNWAENGTNLSLSTPTLSFQKLCVIKSSKYSSTFYFTSSTFDNNFNHFYRNFHFQVWKNAQDNRTYFLFSFAGDKQADIVRVGQKSGKYFLSKHFCNQN